MIDFENVGFAYNDESLVLDGIDLHVAEGEFVCILGGNGSGKSTLAKHINALLAPTNGNILVLGYNTSNPAHVFDVRRVAGMVFQNPDDQLIANLIENDVAFGPENLGIPSAELRERVTTALQSVGMQGFEKTETSALSGGQKQRVAIAGILAMEPHILVLDEASAMLDPRGRAGLIRVVRGLHAAGMTIVMITHFMDEAVFADRIVVLDNGKISIEGTPTEVFSRTERIEHLSLEVPFSAKLSRALQQKSFDVPFCVQEDQLVLELREKISKQGLSTTGSSNKATQTSLPKTTESNCDISDNAAYSRQETPLIEFKDVSYTYQPSKRARLLVRNSNPETRADWGNSPSAYWALHNVSFTLKQGEFFGIAGHTGSGKSTLLQHMNGLLQPTRGRVLIAGADIADKTALTHAREQVGIVFQYPERQLFAETVFQDVAFGPRNLGLSNNEIEQRYLEAMNLVQLDGEALRTTSPFELSGGQQRRVAFAGVLAMSPRILILDEPAAGLDPHAREDFLQLIRQIHQTENTTIVMVSHAMDDLARFCNRILMLNQGEVFALGTPEEVFANASKCKSIGLGVPAAQAFANKLTDTGIALPEPSGLFTLDSLVDALTKICNPPAADSTSNGALQ